MNNIIVLLILSLSYAVSAPAEESLRNHPAVLHEEVHDEYGQYSLRYVTAEGTIVAESGHLIPNPDGVDRVIVVEGEVTYIGDDGKAYTTKYTAGLDGFKPTGDHLPIAPTVLTI